MAIRSKTEKTVELPAESPRAYRTNPEIEKKIDAHIAANPNDHEHYQRLVQENPERAVRTLIHKDQQKFEQDMKLVVKQMPGAQAFYEKQSPEIKARIDSNLEGVNPYFHEKAFVGEVIREMNRQNRKSLTETLAPKAGVGMAAG